MARGAGYIINSYTCVLQDGCSIKEFADAFPFLHYFNGGVMCLNIYPYFDGWGYRFVTDQIKARRGNYLKSWEGYTLECGPDNPDIPEWLDATYNKGIRCYTIFCSKD